ncbi:MAG: hypothetical protein K8E66_07100 [Phycisphaerales bacterium]|nr:hypothetical protein [Phycisphaerales bacterium]
MCVRHEAFVLVFGVVVAGVAGQARAQPVVVELGWVLEREIDFANPISALMNPADGMIYAGQRSQDVFVVNADGSRTKIADTDDVAGLCVDPRNGDLYMAEDYAGNVKRIAFVPLTYPGTLLTPGGMVSTDRGNGSAQEIWAWDTAAAQGEVQLFDTASELVDPVDIAVRGDGVIAIADSGNGVLMFNDDATVTPLVTTPAIVDADAAVFDGRSDDLFVLNIGAHSVLRVDIDTGVATDVITDIPISGANWGGLNVYIGADTQRIIVSSVESDKIYVYAAVPGCNGADLAQPFGLLDLADVTTFATAFLGMNPYADFNEDGLFDLADVLAYSATFLAGCP